VVSVAFVVVIIGLSHGAVFPAIIATRVMSSTVVLVLIVVTIASAIICLLLLVVVKVPLTGTHRSTARRLTGCSCYLRVVSDKIDGLVGGLK
jgi:hypothetical protein